MVNAIYWRKLSYINLKYSKLWPDEYVENYFYIKYLSFFEDVKFKTILENCQNLGEQLWLMISHILFLRTNIFNQCSTWHDYYNLLDTQILLVRYDNILIIALVGNEGFLVFTRLLPVKQVGDQVDREREDHRRVLLRWYWVQGLQWSMVEFN